MKTLFYNILIIIGSTFIVSIGVGFAHPDNDQDTLQSRMEKLEKENEEKSSKEEDQEEGEKESRQKKGEEKREEEESQEKGSQEKGQEKGEEKSSEAQDQEEKGISQKKRVVDVLLGKSLLPKQSKRARSRGLFSFVHFFLCAYSTGL